MNSSLKQYSYHLYSWYEPVIIDLDMILDNATTNKLKQISIILKKIKLLTKKKIIQNISKIPVRAWTL